MHYSEWHRYDYSKGRQYTNHKDVYIKYDEKELVKDRICEILKEVVHVESAVRITTDTHLSEAERLILAIPYECNYDGMIRNFSELLYNTLLTYYFHAEPKNMYFGISNTVLEGHLNSFILREAETIFSKIQNRGDISGRFLRDIDFAKTENKDPGDNYMKDTLIRGVDITLGYRIIMYGSRINGNTMFIPVPDGYDVIGQIYYNLEQVIHQNFVVYDELNERDYLKVTDTLIFKELVSIMKRAKLKKNLRHKILDNVKLPRTLTDNNKSLYGKLAGDHIYDTLNHVDDNVIREASERSMELFNACYIRSTEITQRHLDVKGTSLNTTGSTYVPSEQHDDLLTQATSEDLTGSKEMVAPKPTAQPADAPKKEAEKKIQEDDLIEL